MMWWISKSGPSYQPLTNEEVVELESSDDDSERETQR